jgi:UDP-N-acetylmuramate--alanine ligase
LRVRTYGESPDADYRVTEVSVLGMTTRLTVTAPGAAPRTLTIRVPGRHYALNAAAAFATAVELGVPEQTVISGLEAYRGAQRRMEPKGEADGVRVLDSYGHHPTEVAADLTAARDVAAGGRVIAVFQPHLYSRTRFFAAEFGAALGLADEALVLDVYAAREDPEPGVTGMMIASAVPGGRARFIPDAAAVPDAIAGLAKPGDLVLTMGAGDVTLLGPKIVAALRERAG